MAKSKKRFRSYQQELDYTCGVAVVRTLFGIYGLLVPSERKLAKKLGSTDERGTMPMAIQEYLIDNYFFAAMYEQSSVIHLRRCLDDGMQVILDLALWGGHYVLATGWEKRKGWEGGRFTLADPAAKYEGREDGFTYLAGGNLEGLWFDPLEPGPTERLMIAVSR